MYWSVVYFFLNKREWPNKLIVHVPVCVISGFNLYLVAAHEFGHSLGLRHSQNPESLMYPTYKSSRSSHNLLSKEDIAIINSLYGKEETIQQIQILNVG